MNLLEFWNRRRNLHPPLDGTSTVGILSEYLEKAFGPGSTILDRVMSPIPMILHCPACLSQHIDAPDGDWTNPPHRSHLCARCGHIWRPADVPTEGVQAIVTIGANDSPKPWAAP